LLKFSKSNFTTYFQLWPKESPINYLERPEFLGDAVLGFICSVSLFHMFPHLGEGALSMLRCALVSNVHLSVLAQKLQLDKYFVYVHAQDLARKEDLNNALANCFEGHRVKIDISVGKNRTFLFTNCT